MRGVTTMTIECRTCTLPDCLGCNVFTLSIMLNNGYFDSLLNDNGSIVPMQVKPAALDANKEALINSKIVQCINELCLSDLYVSSDEHSKESDCWLAYIDGLVDLGTLLKGELKHDT